MSFTPHLVAQEEVMAFLDGELSQGRAQAVSVHIENCSDCCGLLQDLQRISQATSTSWQTTSLPLPVENRIQSALVKVPAVSGSPGPPVFRLARLWSWKLWLGGLTAIAVLAVLLSRSALAPVGFDRPLNTVIGLYKAPKPESKSQSADKSTAVKRREGDVTALISDQKSTVFPASMIARTISLSLVTKDFDASRKSLDAVLTRHHGYSASLSVSTEQNAGRSLNASLRIPAAELTDAFAELKALGHVENENQNGEEVTQQHADLVARLKNSRETEQRLQAILTQRTGKISDVLEVEQEIARVRGEIEQMEAEQQTLEHRVDFATIDLKLAEEYKAQLGAPAMSLPTQLHNSLVNGLQTAAGSVLSVILFFSESGPVLLLWLAILVLPARLLWRRYRRALAV